jgi:hypothetical protein
MELTIHCCSFCGSGSDGADSTGSEQQTMPKLNIRIAKVFTLLTITAPRRIS